MLRHWIPIEKLDLKFLLKHNSNPMAISFLENGWYVEEKHESGDKSDGGVKRKKMSIDSIFESFSTDDCYFLSRNPNAISLLEQNPDKINWSELSCNPNAILLLQQNLDKINWKLLSSNSNAMSILEQNIDQVHWATLSDNPNAISLLEKNVDKIIWHYLSSNPNSISLLQQNLDKINWEELCWNPNIFEEEDIACK